LTRGVARTGLVLTLGVGSILASASPGAGAVVAHPSPERSEAAFLKAAESAVASGDINSAVAFYRRAADIAPKDPAPLVALGALMSKTGALGGAVEADRQALARAPGDWRLELELGRLALRLDQPGPAIARFAAVQREHPQAAALNGLGVAYDLSGDHAQARKAYEDGLKLSPDDATLRNNLGLSEALAGDYPAAIATLSALADSPQTSTRYRLNLALAYGLAGDQARAAAASRRDLGEAEIASNARYYQTLRALDDHARSEAILGGVVEDPTAAR
jgi:Flp pilus assembly protein TadD